MEQVLYRVHVRVMITSGRYLSHGVRRSLEAVTFLAAVFFLVALAVLHVSYVAKSPVINSNCILTALSQVQQKVAMPSGFHSVKDVLHDWQQRYDLVIITVPSAKPPPSNATATTAAAVMASESDACMGLCAAENAENEGSCVGSVDDFDSSVGLPLRNSVEILYYNATARSLSSSWGTRYYFSYRRGALMLTQEADSYNGSFSVVELRIDGDLPCFGSRVSKSLVRLINTYDVVVMNWAISAFGGTGYLFNSRSREMFNLNVAADFVTKKGINLADMGRRESYRSTGSQLERLWRWSKRTVLTPILSTVLERAADWFFSIVEYLDDNALAIFKENHSVHDHHHKSLADRDSYELFVQANQYIVFRIGVLFSTSFLFFVSTTLINYLLRETQERMLRFTFLLNYHITHGMPFSMLIATHVIGSLVFVPILLGVYFFLFEFFADQLLAFLVLLVVWMGEVFSILCLRSRVTIRYFPHLFCCYFFLLHIYIFSHPFGFSYVALAATMLTLLHSMMHFWNVYEVPAFENGSISPVRPRQRLCYGPEPAPVIRQVSNAAADSPSSNAVSLTTPASTSTTSANLSAGNSPGYPLHAVAPLAATAITSSPPRHPNSNVSAGPSPSSNIVRPGQLLQYKRQRARTLSHDNGKQQQQQQQLQQLQQSEQGSVPSAEEGLRTLDGLIFPKMMKEEMLDRRQRADSLGSHSKTKVMPNIYESVAARRMRLEREKQMSQQADNQSSGGGDLSHTLQLPEQLQLQPSEEGAPLGLELDEMTRTDAERSGIAFNYLESARRAMAEGSISPASRAAAIAPSSSQPAGVVGRGRASTTSSVAAGKSGDKSKFSIFGNFDD